MLVGCFALALTNRLQVARTNMERDTFCKYFKGAVHDMYDQLLHMVSIGEHKEPENIFSGHLHDRGELILLDDPSDPRLEEYKELLLKPVSTEEIQVAMMLLTPKLLE